ADAADHHLPANARELVHGRKPADIDEIADLAVTAEGGRGREDRIIADEAIVADMAVVHEEAAVADPGEAAALHRTDVHGHAFAQRAAGTDLKARRLALVAQVLRRAAEHDERRDHAIGADRGVAHHLHMGDQLAVAADDRMRSDDAIGANAGPVA